MKKIIFFLLISFNVNAMFLSDDDIKQQQVNSIRKAIDLSCEKRYKKIIEGLQRNPNSKFYKWRLRTIDPDCLSIVNKKLKKPVINSIKNKSIYQKLRNFFKKK